MFMADVFVMTPEGAIVARPASQVRAGEERVAARRLSDIGVPILRSINNRGTFEGADLMWLDPQTAIVGRGLRTNDDGASQIEQLLTSMGIRMIKVDLPFGSMHLMGMLRIVDRNLAIVWPSRFVHRGVDALRERGFHVAMLPENEEIRRGAAFNFVTIAPRTIVMAAGNPRTQAWFEQHGITCVTTPVDELAKAAGAIGCLTGIVAREM
jgi:N-dimethylarginine dimethylaminohydrolase